MGIETQTTSIDEGCGMDLFLCEQRERPLQNKKVQPSSWSGIGVSYFGLGATGWFFFNILIIL
jgi:hypothetical protein